MKVRMSASPGDETRPRPHPACLIGALWGSAAAWALAARRLAQVESPLPASLATLAIGAAIGVAVVLLLRWRLGERLCLWSRRERTIGLGAAIVGGCVVTAAIPLEMPSPPWAPLSRLALTATGEKNIAANSAEVWIDGISVAGQTIGASDLTPTPGWERRENALVSFRNQPATLHWQGRVGGEAGLLLRRHAWSGLACVTWNNAEHALDLYSAEASPLRLALEPAVAPLARTYACLAFAAHAIGIGGALWLLGTILILVRRSAPIARPTIKLAAVFMLPCAIVWTVCLLAYWPALMSSDSIDQWEQVLQGRFYDDHPALSTILLWVASRVAQTPAVAGVMQIAALSVLTGWGLWRFVAAGGPRWVAWLTCLLIALSPVNAPLAVTLWKDVLFSAAMAWLSILVLGAICDEQRRAKTFVAIGIAAALLTALRHNGIVPAVATLALLGIALRKELRLPLIAIAVFVVTLGGIKGGLYRAFDVQPTRIQGWIYLPIHEIGAHVAAGTQILEHERPILRAIRDADNWPYDPYYVNPLLFDGHFSYDRAQQHGREALALAARLAWRAPGVSLHRALSVSSLVWRLTTPPGSVYWTVLGARSGGQISAVYLPNRLGIEPAPLLPAARQRIADAISASMAPSIAWLFWRPALYLYLLIFATWVAAARLGDRRVWVAAVPALANSLLIALMTPAQDFRYQYGVYLTALFLVPFLLCMRTTRQTLTRARLSCSSDEDG
ncbi:MAG: hypothetical protein ACKVX7_18710 [Planctomycetota bacterium]